MAWLVKVFRYLTSNPDTVLLGVILFTLGNSIFAVAYLNNLEVSFSHIYQEDLRGENTLQNARSSLLLLDAELKDAVLLTGKTDLQKVRKAIDARARAVNASLSRASATVTIRSEKAVLSTLKSGVKDYLEKVAFLANQLEAGDSIADEQVESLNRIKAGIEADFLRMNRAKVDDARRTFQDVEFQLHFSMILTLGTLMLTVVFRFVRHAKRRSKPV